MDAIFFRTSKEKQRRSDVINIHAITRRRVVVWKSCKKGLREDGIIQTKPKYDSAVIKLRSHRYWVSFFVVVIAIRKQPMIIQLAIHRNLFARKPILAERKAMAGYLLVTVNERVINFRHLSNRLHFLMK